MDDRELLDRLKTGDQSAFDAIFRAHYPSLVSLAQGMLRDQSAAEGRRAGSDARALAPPRRRLHSGVAARLSH
jgi:DNA-directed RNA polymerase specialized sigma24 family protein